MRGWRSCRALWGGFPRSLWKCLSRLVLVLQLVVASQRGVMFQSYCFDTQNMCGHSFGPAFCHCQWWNPFWDGAGFLNSFMAICMCKLQNGFEVLRRGRHKHTWTFHNQSILDTPAFTTCGADVVSHVFELVILLKFSADIIIELKRWFGQSW